MAEHNGHDMNSPWWLKLFIQVGFPTAIAMLLLGALLGWMPSPLMEKLAVLEYQGWQTSTTLRAICYSLQPTKAERWRCEPWKPEPQQ